MYRKRMRGRRRFLENEERANRNSGITSSVMKNLFNAAIAFVANDLASSNSKIKNLINKLSPKLTYDDTKEIKNAKYRILTDKQK